MQIIFTNVVIVITLLTSAIAASNDALATKTKEERSRNSKRIRRDISKLLQSKEVQSRLPVEVDLSGIVDYLAQEFDKNITALREEFNQKLESITGNLTSVTKKPSTNNNVTDNVRSTTPTTMPTCKGNEHLTFAGIPEGEPSNLKPPAKGEWEPSEPITGFTWKSILGGCIKQSELNDWILLLHRDIERAGDFFKNRDDRKDQDDRENRDWAYGFEFPSHPEIASWYGLQKIVDLTKKNKHRDMILAYHCGGKVRCTRYGDFELLHDYYQRPSDVEVYREGMFPHLLDQYINSWFKEIHNSHEKTIMRPILTRLNCTFDQFTGGQWFIQRHNPACPTLCPTCDKVGGSIERIGFDASRCTHVFMALGRVHEQ